jgi:hypothetical protein
VSIALKLRVERLILELPKKAQKVVQWLNDIDSAAVAEILEDKQLTLIWELPSVYYEDITPSKFHQK